MSYVLECSPTRADMLDASLTLIEQMQADLATLSKALTHSPHDMTVVAEALARLGAQGDACWQALSTYFATEECAGNA